MKLGRQQNTVERTLQSYDQEVRSIVQEYTSLLNVLGLQLEELSYQTREDPEAVQLVKHSQTSLDRMRVLNSRLSRLESRVDAIDATEVRETSLHPSSRMAKTRSGTVLLVEDEIDFQRVLRRKLEDEGFEVYVASTKAKAEAILRERLPELRAIVCDESLPDGEGIGLLKLAHALYRNSSVRGVDSAKDVLHEPQLILTSARHTLKPVPGVTHLRKPFNFELLLHAIEF